MRTSRNFIPASLGLLVLPFACLVACGDAPDSGLPEAPSKPRAQFDGYTLDDLGRLIAAKPAGLPARLSPLSASASYGSMVRKLDAAWARYERDHLAQIRHWRTQLAGRGTEEVFYPFGGPDAVHPVLLFPNARRYTLFGLEKVGRIPELAPGPGATERIERIHAAVRGVLGRNFFLTLRMTGSVGATPDSGVAAILLFFLARLDLELLDAYPIDLTGDGAIVPAAGDEAANGVRILFRGDDRTVRSLDYFQLNISDANLPRTPGLRAWLEERRDLTTMLKAASYLLYLDAFDDVRGVILNRSRLILSDASGMPFHFLTGERWRLTPYGNYVGPIGLFRIRHEPDRLAFYRKQGGRALPFAYGYHPTNPNVLLAERTGDPGQEREPRPLVFDGHDTEGVTTFYRGGRQVILGLRPDQK